MVRDIRGGQRRAPVAAIFDGDRVMMDGMMNMGAMHWGMGIVLLILISFLVLGIAAFVKYLFFRS